MDTSESRQRSARSCAAVLLAGITVLTAGCGRSLGTSDVARAIDSQLPECRLERTAHIAVGPLVMSLARAVAKRTGELEPDARATLGSIRRAEVATYTVIGTPHRGALARLLALRDRLEGSGWEMAVTEVDTDDATVVLMRFGADGTVRGLMAVQLSGAQLEIACVEGRLDRVLAEEVRQQYHGYFAPKRPGLAPLGPIRR
jgi:hypothetical protein